jgi:hypothetical protein
MTRPVRSTSSPACRCRIIAEQHDADFVLVHVERDAEHTAGKLSSSSKPAPGRPETLAMPVETL